MVAKLTEAAFTRRVIDLAKLFGWRVAHFRPARTATGWRTAMSGDVGFPDLILCRRQVIRVVELKVGTNDPTAEQVKWLDAFRTAGVWSCVWRPEDWDRIREALE